jgi:hypothetical protein
LLAYLVIMMSPPLLISGLAILPIWLEKHQRLYLPAVFVLAIFWGGFLLAKKPSFAGIAEVYAQSRIHLFTAIINQFWGA